MTQHHAWLFDNREAWQRAISDSRWSYDLPMSRFMAIYMEYRGSANGSAHHDAFLVKAPISVSSAMSFSQPVSPMAMAASALPKSSGVGQILSQSEIDSLLNSLG